MRLFNILIVGFILFMGSAIPTFWSWANDWQMVLMAFSVTVFWAFCFGLALFITIKEWKAK